MATARISRNHPIGSPVLQKCRPGWVVQFDSDRPQHADPLTGWAGGNEPQAQVRMLFPTLEAATGYCQRNGHPYVVHDEPRHRLLLQSYADNFR